MNWDAIAALAELVGGLGVILTLVFLAFQIRHNSQAVQNETLAALNATMTANIMVFAQSGELSKILRNGLNRYESLSQVDRFRFNLGISTTLRNYETAFFAWRRGLLEQQYWNGMEATLLQLFESEGVRCYWTDNSQTYSETFRAHLESRATPGTREAPEPVPGATSRRSAPAVARRRRQRRGGACLGESDRAKPGDASPT